MTFSASLTGALSFCLATTTSAVALRLPTLADIVDRDPETDGQSFYPLLKGEEYNSRETVFVHYDLINRSENTYHDFYFGVFADVDLGYAWDDYIASYVKKINDLKPNIFVTKPQKK